MSVNSGSHRIYTKTQPLHWDNELGRSNIIVEQELKFLEENVLRVTYTIKNNETFTVSGAFHELPVSYLETNWGEPRAYVGSSPWTDDTNVAHFSIATESFHDPTPTERWIGWFRPWTLWGQPYPLSLAHGLALYVPPQSDPEIFRLGKLGKPGVPGTHYMQMWRNSTLAPGQTKTYVAYLVGGYFYEIRSAIYDLAGV